MRAPRWPRGCSRRTNGRGRFAPCRDAELSIVSPEFAGTGVSDILWDYAQAAFRRAGYSTVTGINSIFYHNNVGNSHCATNVRRELPPLNWWEYE